MFNNLFRCFCVNVNAKKNHCISYKKRAALVLKLLCRKFQECLHVAYLIYNFYQSNLLHIKGTSIRVRKISRTEKLNTELMLNQLKELISKNFKIKLVLKLSYNHVINVSITKLTPDIITISKVIVYNAHLQHKIILTIPNNNSILITLKKLRCYDRLYDRSKTWEYIDFPSILHCKNWEKQLLYVSRTTYFTRYNNNYHCETCDHISNKYDNIKYIIDSIRSNI